MTGTTTTDRGMTSGMGMTGMGMMPGMNMGMMMPGMMGMPSSGMMMPSMGGMTGMPGMMVPRCTIKMEKMDGGMRMTCTAQDKTAAMMMQNLCNMMAGGMCSCCMTMNGMMTCCCNMSCCTCKVEMIDMGVMMTCTSGDANCAKTAQACCDCMTAMMMPGCTCCVMMNGMPVCCMAC